MAADKHVTENGKVYRWYWVDDEGEKIYYPQLYVSLKGVMLGTRYYRGDGQPRIYIEVADNWNPVDE